MIKKKYFLGLFCDHSHQDHFHVSAGRHLVAAMDLALTLPPKHRFASQFNVVNTALMKEETFALKGCNITLFVLYSIPTEQF